MFNIKIITAYLLLMLTQYVQAAPNGFIAINQLGYVNNWPKSALIINSKTPLLEAALIDSETEIEVLKIQPSAERNAQLGIEVQRVDFSVVSKSGKYYLKQGGLKSADFIIDSFPYHAVYLSALRTYFIQRCGVELQDESGLNHAACHSQDAFSLIETGGVKASHQEVKALGGWHDAGDFGKYIAPASATVNRLLSLYERSPGSFQDSQLNIPESGNGVPDLLDEVSVELEWMLTMQRQDGAVYRKLSGKQWPSVASPESDKQPRFVFGVSSPETAKFSSSLAIASRVFKPIDADRSLNYLKAAEKAWRWLILQPKQYVDIGPDDDKGSGKYLASETDQEVSLESDLDDRLAAAIELYLTTKKIEYASYIEENIEDIKYTLYEWKDMTALSFYHLMTLDKTPNFSNFRKEIMQQLLKRADQLLKSNLSNAYGLANTRFIWGSNKMVAEEGITLTHAYQIKTNKLFLKAAVDQLDFLLGKNPNNVSFLTGYGDSPVRNPTHLHMRGAKIVIKGMMVGGPNALGQDDITPKNLGAMSYVDDSHAYASNEYAIDYNAAFIGLVFHLMKINESEKLDTRSVTEETIDSAINKASKPTKIHYER